MRPSRTDHVLVLSEEYLPRKGGHIIWLHEVCKRLDSCTVLTGRVEGQPVTGEVEGVPVRRLRLSRTRWLRPESLLMYIRFVLAALVHVLRRRPCCIVAARIISEGVVGVIAGKLLRVPTVVFAHGEEINRLSRPVPAGARRRGTVKLKKWFLWRAFKAADRIIANSTFTRDLLAAGGIDANKIELVHPGTDPAFFSPAPPDDQLVEQYDLSGRRVLLTVGRLRRRKGQDTVIRALGQIARIHPEVVYVVSGTGPYEKELKQLARDEGVAERVRFVGEVSFATLPKLFHIADVFVMPNRVLESNDAEGFGIVFLEAGACEVPVVGGRSGGVPDAIEDGKTGLLVDGGSVDEVAEACTRLLSDESLCRRFGTNGRRRVVDGLTWRHSAESVRGVIEGM